MKTTIQYTKQKNTNLIQLLNIRKQHQLTFSELEHLINKINETPTKKIQITIYADYLTAYKQLYTNKQDKKIIHKIYQDNKKHYQWKEKHLKQFLTGENILNNENYLNTYYTYIRNQLEKDYNIIELNNGKYITIQGVKT